MLKNKVSPRLIPLHSIEKTIKRLQATITSRRYSMAIDNPSDIYQCDSSFVGFEDGRLVILIHVPIFKTQSLMKLYQYKPTPISSVNNANEQIIITPEKTVLGINQDFTLYSTYTEEDIHHNCKNLHNNYYCRNNNILKRTNNKNCLISLYTKSIEEIKNRCSIEMINKKEMVHQINTTSFYVYIPKSTIMYVTCSNKQEEEKHEIWGYSIITLKPGCKASIQEHIFSAGIKVEEKTSLKYMNININLRDLLKIGKQEEAELLEII